MRGKSVKITRHPTLADAEQAFAASGAVWSMKLVNQSKQKRETS